MDKINEGLQSLSTRLYWLKELDEDYETDSVEFWETIALRIYENLNKKDFENLIRQCQVVGLMRLANDIEFSMGEIHK